MRSAVRSTSAVYRIGSRGTVVKAIQRRVGVRSDGYFGRSTSGAVKSWQRTHQLAPTGVVTLAVRRAMRV